MSGLYIKGIEMPTVCEECPCFVFQGLGAMSYCNVTSDSIGFEEAESHRLKNCPLIELPDHGDLIDREALVALWEEDIVNNKESGITDYAYTDMEQIYREFIYDAKMFRAVITAERSE